MAHLIDTTTGKPAIAFVGLKPWHGLGQSMQPGMSIEEWRKAAGLNFNVLRSQVLYESAPGYIEGMPKRDVLFRSDTGAPLSVVSDEYNIVQPAEVLDFFRKLSDIGGFELETAGALSGGKRIWALAKVNDGAPVIGHDHVRPYVLLSTSYDGTLATTAKFTTIRVVCHNTLTMSVGRYTPEGYQSKTEDDVENCAVNTMVRIPHSTMFDPGSVRQQLGIAANAWERWLIETRLLAEKQMSADEADNFVASLMLRTRTSPLGQGKDVRDSRGYKKIMELFKGEIIGAELAGGSNRWAMLNAVTEYIDHARGHNAETRLKSAWFGQGDNLKTTAYKMLVEA